MNRDQWVWMPHPGHFICARDCKFFLNTWVPGGPGGWIVSTVGEYFPDSRVREIFAKSRRISLEGKGDYRDADYLEKIGYEEIGCGRKYETMVFPAQAIEPSDETEACCPYRMSGGTEQDFEGYNTPGEAYRGHLRMCEQWDGKERPNENLL